MPAPDDVPDEKEVIAATTLTFDIVNPRKAVEALAATSPEFAAAGPEGGEEIFRWTRAFPPGHPSPMAGTGARQVIGTVRVRDAEIVAEAGTLGWAVKLIKRTKETVGGQARLRHTRWMGAWEMADEIRSFIKENEAALKSKDDGKPAGGDA